MNPGEGRSCAQRVAGRHFTVAGLFVCAALAGCATDRAAVEKNLMTAANAPPQRPAVIDTYRVACPDVLAIRTPVRPEFGGEYVIGPTGRIDFGDYGAPRVEGRSLAEIARLIANETGQPPSAVEVRVTQFRSQFVLLSGQVIGWQRNVPYFGQETVLDLLQRVGGITLAAEPRDVYVVRTHLADSQRPEVFHIDLQAIVMKHDQKTNMALLPYDQIYVGESRQAHLEKAVPAWVRPIYQSIWNIAPDSTPHLAAATPPASRWVSGE